MTTLNGASPASAPPQQVSLALMRGFFALFLPWVFRVLHPGGRELAMDWYLLAMVQAFQETAVGRSRRLVINVPPRHLKSITATAYIAWMLGRTPSLKLMVATYGDKLGRDHLERLRIIMTHPFYRHLFPGVLLRDGGIGRGHIGTVQGGGCRVVTVNGATTGFGADIIIIDDAMKAEDIVSEARREELDRFYRQTLLTRLNDKRRGIIISIQQRLGEDDLPARLLETGSDHLCLPSYDDRERLFDIGFGRQYRRAVGEVLRPQDEPMEVLRRFEIEMGKQDFATQYLQQPGALGGNMIPLVDIPRFDLNSVDPRLFDMLVWSWDTASSEEPGAAYSVGLLFGSKNKRWYLIDVVRQRLNYARLRDTVVAHWRRTNPDHVLIEDKASGSHLYEDLRYTYGLKARMMMPTADKATRMMGQLGMIEDGKLLLPKEAPWLDVLTNEMRLFPNSRYNDQVDALSQFLGWAKIRQSWKRIPVDPVSGRKMYIERPDDVRRP